MDVGGNGLRTSGISSDGCALACCVAGLQLGSRGPTTGPQHRPERPVYVWQSECTTVPAAAPMLPGAGWFAVFASSLLMPLSCTPTAAVCVQVLSKLIPAVIAKLTSSHDATRRKVGVGTCA